MQSFRRNFNFCPQPFFNPTIFFVTFSGCNVFVLASLACSGLHTSVVVTVTVLLVLSRVLRTQTYLQFRYLAGMVDLEIKGFFVRPLCELLFWPGLFKKWILLSTGINQYPVDNVVCFVNTYLLYSNVSGG